MRAELVNLEDIIPDAQQPRKYFNEFRIKDLASSIKKHGIKNPLIVEDFGRGKFLLVDGERRFKAAHVAGLKEVPVIISKPNNSTNRMIEQFHLQEQHEGWSSMEKANAVYKLAEELKMDVAELAELLNLPRQTIDGYLAFRVIIEKDKFEKLNLPINWIRKIASFKRAVSKTYEKAFKEGFIRSDEKKLEKSVIAGIESGEIARPTDLVKLVDIFGVDPSNIKKFIDNELDIKKVYLAEDAISVASLRQALHTGRYMIPQLVRICESKTIKISDESKATFKNLKKALDKLVGSFE